MSKIFVQCAECGEIYDVEEKYISTEAEWYVRLYCPSCKRETNHLPLGKSEDTYIYYNPNIDPRYY